MTMNGGYQPPNPNQYGGAPNPAVAAQQQQMAAQQAAQAAQAKTTVVPPIPNSSTVGGTGLWAKFKGAHWMWKLLILYMLYQAVSAQF